MKWRKQCYLKLNSGLVHESSYHRQVEMGLTLRDKWSCVIMCLYQVQAACDAGRSHLWPVLVTSPKWHFGGRKWHVTALQQQR